MNINDFRYMRRGIQLRGLKNSELGLLEKIDMRGPGNDRALLALHGFGSSPAAYRNLLPKIEHYDAIVCPVLAGHGQSLDAFFHAKASDWLESAKLSCEELFKNYQRVDVMGLSLGGLLALELSQMFPINHLYLLAPALELHLQVKSSLNLGKALRYLGFHYLRNRAGNILSPETAEIAYVKLPIPSIIEMLQYQLHFKIIAPKCPVDLFLGEHDEVVDSERVAKIFSNLSNVRIHWLHNSAHVLPLDNDVDEIVRCINQCTRNTIAVTT